MDIVEKIEALLKQADSTEHPEERDAFYAGARRLMVKHSIEEADLNLARGVTESPETEEWTYSPNNYWMPGKRALIDAACKMAGSGTTFIYYSRAGTGEQRCRLIGYQAERTVAKAAYQSLYLQARVEASRAGFTSKREVSSFLAGFAQGVIGKIVMAQIDEEQKLSESTALVLRDRSLAVVELADAQGAKPDSGIQVDQFAHANGVKAGQEADLITQERLS